MGYATAISECGCIHTLIMESGKMIRYERCAEHYVPEIDDLKIVKAAENKRQHEKQLWAEATKFFHGGKDGYV